MEINKTQTHKENSATSDQKIEYYRLLDFSKIQQNRENDVTTKLNHE